MKAVSRSILFISLWALWVKCDDDEATRRNYPRLKTLPVSEVNLDGARFNAEIIFRGDFEVINYGFVWGETESPTLERSDRLIYAENIQSEKFSEKIETTLKGETAYFVRAFIETNDFIVYGENVSFIALGSGGPEISSFAPIAGTIGDTISIFGSNFSFVSDQNVVEFDDLAAEVTHTTDSLLKVIVPLGLTESESQISVSIFGNRATSSTSFNLTTPTISQFSPSTGTDFTEVVISGEDFCHIPSLNQVQIGGKDADVNFASKTQLIVIVPAGILTKENNLRIEVAGQAAIADATFTMLAPVITDFQPKAASIRESVTIEGENFSTVLEGNKVYFDTAQATILEVTATSLEVEVPYGVPVNSTISIITAEQEVSTSEPFQIQTPELLMATPEKATVNKEITLTGNNFSPLNEDNAVSFNGISANVLSSSKTTLQVSVPSGIEQRSIEVTVNTGGHMTLPVDFEYIGGDWSSTGFFPGEYRTGAINFVIGDDLYFGLGIHFTTVLNDFWKYNFTTRTWTMLNDFPGDPRRLAIAFTIEDKGYVGLGSGNATNAENLNDFWEYDAQSDTWNQLPDYPGQARYASTAFSVNGVGFVGLGQTREESFVDFYKFDPQTSGWEQISSFPGSSRSFASHFIIDEIAYVGLGAARGFNSDSDDGEYDNDFWKYNYLEDSWESIQNFPEIGLVLTSHFAINGKGYVGMGYRVDNHQIRTFSTCYEYDPEQNTWTETERNSFGNGYGAQNAVYAESAYFLQMNRINQNPSSTFEIFRPY